MNIRKIGIVFDKEVCRFFNVFFQKWVACGVYQAMSLGDNSTALPALSFYLFIVAVGICFHNMYNVYNSSFILI